LFCLKMWDTCSIVYVFGTVHCDTHV
jgi:hypothetical protein